MATIIALPLFILAMLFAWFLGASMANDGACAAIAFHSQPFKFVEQLLLLCRVV